MVEIAEPSVWLFDGTDPERDLPRGEAEQVAELTVTFDDPIYAPLPETAVDAVTELFRGFYAHTPYRRLAKIEREDDVTVAVYGEKRAHIHEDDGWKSHIHERDIEEMQSQLIDFFGPLWRVRRKPDGDDRVADREDGDRTADQPGAVVIRRVVGRRFHYQETDHR